MPCGSIRDGKKQSEKGLFCKYRNLDQVSNCADFSPAHKLDRIFHQPYHLLPAFAHLWTIIIYLNYIIFEAIKLTKARWVCVYVRVLYWSYIIINCWHACDANWTINFGIDRFNAPAVVAAAVGVFATLQIVCCSLVFVLFCLECQVCLSSINVVNFPAVWYLPHGTHSVMLISNSNRNSYAFTYILHTHRTGQ